MGYQEKRLWILFGTEFAVYAVYFWALHHHHVRLIDTAWIVLGLIVMQVILHTALALTTRSEQRDERDRAIELRGFRNAYFTLAVTVAAMIGTIFHSQTFRHGSAMLMVNTLIFILAIAEFSKLITQVTLYRRQA